MTDLQTELAALIASAHDQGDITPAQVAERLVSAFQQVGWSRKRSDDEWALKAELSGWANPAQWEPVYRFVRPESVEPGA